MRHQAAARTLGQQARVWLVRGLLNLLVIALLGAALYGIYWATEYTVELQVRKVLEVKRLEALDLPVEGRRGLKSRIPGNLEEEG